MNANIRISPFETSRYLITRVFLIMGYADGLSQIVIFRAVNVYKKRFMPKKGQFVVLKGFLIWKKIRKIFKILSELKAQVDSQIEAPKWEAMAVPSGKETLFSLFEKSSHKNVSWVGVYIFFSTSRKRNK